MSFLRRFLDLFNIDDAGNKIAARGIFLFLLVINTAVFFMPPEYSDFSKVISWANAINSISDPNQITDEMMNIPFTAQNIEYLLIVLFVLFVSLCCGFLYSGICVRYRRLFKTRIARNGRQLRVASSKQLAQRFIILVLVFMLFYFPMVLAASYLMLPFILCMPYLICLPASYLSGDHGVFESIPRVAKYTIGYYLLNMQPISVVALCFFLLKSIIGLIGNFASTASYVLSATVNVWFLMVLFRLGALLYSGIIEKREIRIIKNPEM